MSEKQYNFQVSVAMANIIVAALQEGPYKLTAPILAILQKQAEEQDRQAETTPTDLIQRNSHGQE